MNTKNLKFDFYNLIKDYPNAKHFINKLLTQGELLLFGGAVRTYLENGFREFPRDFDIVIKKNERENDIENCFEKLSYSKNRFGGFKVFVDGIEFDIWEIENTWAFKQDKVPIKEENLSDTVFLNIDSIVFNLNKNIIYNNKYKKCMETKILDIVLPDNPFVELNLLRAIIFKRKYNLRFSTNLIYYFKEFKEKQKDNFNDKLYQLQFSHFGRAKLSQSEINEEVVNITQKEEQRDYYRICI